MKWNFLVLFILLNAGLSYGSNEYDSLIKVSKALRIESRFSAAVANYNYLLTKVEKGSDQEAYLYNVLGNTYLRLGEKQKMLESYYMAIKINQANNNLEYLSKNYNNLSLYFTDEGQYQKSSEYLRLAQKLIPDKHPLQGSILLKIGQNYHEQVDEHPAYMDSTINMYMRALGPLKEIENYDGLEVLYNSLAVLYLDQGKFEYAENYYKKSIHLADSIGNYRSSASSTRNLGVLYLKQKDFKRALIEFNKVLELAEYVKDPVFFTHLYHNLVKVNMETGNVEAASQYFQMYNDLRDSLNDEQTIESLKEMETRYETELKDRTLAEQERTIASTLFEKRVFLFISLFLFLLITLVVWFFYQKQKYLKQLKQEEISNMKKDQELRELNAMMHGQEEERNRIANDLHDRLGARLSSIKLHLQGSELSNDQLKFVNHIDEAIKETREISHNLSTDMLTRFGISTALKDVIRSINESGKIIADVALFGVDKRWPLEVERNAYFILLELINNTLKHSQAKSFMIQVNQVDEEVNIFYEDDGLGFDPKKVIGKGLGMRSLNARINSLNGSLDFNSQPGNGVQVVITFQLDQLLDKKTDTIKTLSNE